MKTIKILPVKEYEDECKLRREINPILPNCKGDVGLLVGRIASGKSVTLSNILLRKELLGDLFGTIHLISNTAGNDDTSRFLVNSDNVIVYDSYSDDIIRNINDVKKEQ